MDTANQLPDSPAALVGVDWGEGKPCAVVETVGGPRQRPDESADAFLRRLVAEGYTFPRECGPRCRG